MRLRIFVLGLLAALSIAVGITVAPAHSAPPSTTGLSVPISSAQSNPDVNGVFTITSFAMNSAGQLVANGTFTGTALVGGVTQAVTSTASAVVTPSGTCQILDLTLGPLHLDLLGLVVDLNQVHLTITAESGPGNLLGNLLCAVANLLNPGQQSPTALQQIINLLNQLIARL
jgi:hypothetical protein